MRMDNQLWRKRGTQLAGVIGLLAILFFVYKLMDQRLVQSQAAVEREINAANATVTAQTNLRITADVQAQAAQETAVAAQHLLATVEAKASDIIATATAQSQIPLTPTTDPHSLEQDQETLAYRLALEAELILNEQPQLLERSILLAIESVQRHPNSGAVDILKNGISLLPRYEMALNHLSAMRDAQISRGTWLTRSLRRGTGSVTCARAAATTGPSNGRTPASTSNAVHPSE
jgi:hypothetical protein